MRQIVLDTETTGINPKDGHRIIEIGCVELVNRKLTGNHYHVFINPQRIVEEEAVRIHGITNEYLEDKPLFAEVAQAFLAFVKGAELVIHNAAFDVGFINHEFGLLNPIIKPVDSVCGVVDTLAMAREKHPGQKNNLNALCKRYGIDNGHRTLHGALLDAEILADVYLLLSGGQTDLALDANKDRPKGASGIRRINGSSALHVVKASNEELSEHAKYLESMSKNCESTVWTS